MKRIIIGGLALCTLPLIYLSIIYNRLPSLVPVNYSLNGNVHDYIPKSETFFFVGLLTVVTLVVFLILSFVHKLAPKMANTENAGRLQKIAFAVAVFLVFVQCWLINVFRDGVNDMSFKLLLILLSLLLAVIGNYMPNLRQNHVAGFRISWTLRSETNWRKTHQFAGKLWFYGGIFLAIIAVVLPFEAALVTFGISLLVLLIVPGYYSYLHRKRRVRVDNVAG